MKTVRIGAGQGFYGDSPDGAVAVAERGEVSYICCDALAELTMAILQRDHLRDPNQGFARDLPVFLRALLPVARDQGIRIITNAGGVNPGAAAAAVRGVATELGMQDLRVATVRGDDIGPRIDELRDGGVDLRNMDTGADLATIRDRVVFGVAYLGARPIVEALERGADVVVTGRVADASLFVAPMVRELGWGWEDWDRLATGVVLGHLMECSGQATGGNFSGDWWNIPDLDRIGYPVCEVAEDGSALLTKPAGTGGRVSVDTVAEQLLYEVLDPRRYLNPDVVADFTTVRLAGAGTDTVAVSEVHGSPRPEQLKAILGYLDGWLGAATIAYSWPHALAKARHAALLVERLAERAGLVPLEQVTEFIGLDSLHGDAADLKGAADANEVTLRVAGRFATEAEAGRFPRLATPLALNGPPFIGGGSTPQPPRSLLGVWPTLVPRQRIEEAVAVDVEAAG
ncbi:MAG TPA: acyclic terpene utilization AtuA family protein [Candidatus Dormibacteraeota bacterium]